MGKLGDTGSVDLLFDILERRGRTELLDFEYGEFYNEDKDVFSQYILFAARALISIVKEYPELKSRIMERILRILQAPDYKIMITLRENSASLHDLKPKLVEYIKRNI